MCTPMLLGQLSRLEQELFRVSFPAGCLSISGFLLYFQVSVFFYYSFFSKFFFIQSTVSKAINGKLWKQKLYYS